MQKAALFRTREMQDDIEEMEKEAYEMKKNIEANGSMYGADV